MAIGIQPKRKCKQQLWSLIILLFGVVIFTTLPYISTARFEEYRIDYKYLSLAYNLYTQIYIAL